MDLKGNYFDQSMDDIVFDTKNKGYGAYVLRGTYQKHLLKAIGISVGVFVFSLYTPKIAKAIGLFKEQPVELMDSTVVVLTPPPSIKPDEPPPPPPPPAPPVVRPTERFVEMMAVEKEKAEDPPPTIEEMDKKDIGTEKVEGEITDEPPPVVEEVFGGGEVIDTKVYEDVDKKARFKGGEAAFQEWVSENVVYPEAEKQNGITGNTIVRFTVTMDGTVEDVRVKQTSGSARLDAEAMKVIRKASHLFSPAQKAGKNVNSYCVLTITFDVEDE